jgi:hypothetical protein
VASKLAYSVCNFNVSPATGEVGRADFDGAAIAHAIANVTGVSEDTKVFWVLNADDEGRLIFAQTHYGSTSPGSASPGKISIYKAGGEPTGDTWGTQVYPSGGGTTTWGDSVNIYTVARDGSKGKIYFIDYDMHKVYAVTNDSGDDYVFETGISYSFGGGGPKQCFGVDVDVVGNGLSGNDYDADIFALFIRGDNVYGGDYASSVLVKLPPDLSFPKAYNDALAANAFSVKPYGGDLYIAAVGGKQNYDGNWNAGSRIIKAGQGDLKAINLLRAASSENEGDLLKDHFDFRDIAFKIAPNGEVFILNGRLDTGSGATIFKGNIFRTTMGVLATANPDPSENPDGVLISQLQIPDSDYIAVTNEDNPPSLSASLWALLYSPADDAVWFANDDVLSVYRYDTSDPQNPQIVRVGLPIGMGVGGLAPAGNSLNTVTIYGLVPQLKGAQDPLNVSTMAPAEGEEDDDKK